MSLPPQGDSLLVWIPVYWVAALGFHVILCHLVRRGGAFAKFLLAGGTGGLALALHAFLRSKVDAEVAAGLLVYALACEFYIFLFSMVSSSISVSLLLILGTNQVTSTDLETLYSSHGMIVRRMEKLVTSGLLSQNERGYTITEKGQRLVRVLDRLGTFFGHVNARARIASQPKRTT
jgi:hypothetical protein